MTISENDMALLQAAVNGQAQLVSELIVKEPISMPATQKGKPDGIFLLLGVLRKTLSIIKLLLLTRKNVHPALLGL